MHLYMTVYFVKNVASRYNPSQSRWLMSGSSVLERIAGLTDDVFRFLFA